MEGALAAAKFTQPPLEESLRITRSHAVSILPLILVISLSVFITTSSARNQWAGLHLKVRALFSYKSLIDSFKADQKENAEQNSLISLKDSKFAKT